MESFPWEPSPTISQSNCCWVRPCHPLPLPSSFACPSSGSQHGSRWQWWWQPGWQCLGGTVSPASASRQQAPSLWGRTVAPWWGGWLVGVCKATSSPLLAVGRFSVARARCGSCTPTRCLWDVEEQQQLGPACGRLRQSRLRPSQIYPVHCRELLTQAGL